MHQRPAQPHETVPQRRRLPPRQRHLRAHRPARVPRRRRLRRQPQRVRRPRLHRRRRTLHPLQLTHQVHPLRIRQPAHVHRRQPRPEPHHRPHHTRPRNRPTGIRTTLRRNGIRAHHPTPEVHIPCHTKTVHVSTDSPRRVSTAPEAPPLPLALRWSQRMLQAEHLQRLPRDLALLVGRHDPDLRRTVPARHPPLGRTALVLSDGSSRSPRMPNPSTTAARSTALRSPMPPVNTRASRRPRTAA